MKKSIFIILVSALFTLVSADIFAETSLVSAENNGTGIFPDLTDYSLREETVETAYNSDITINKAIWPFGDKEETGSSQVKPKSSRKAFFLSLILPGLGEAYVGSKRSFLFLGIEAFAWWTYLSNTNKGNDLENDYENYGDKYWHYYDTTSSAGDELKYNYWEWVKHEFTIPDDIGPEDFAEINDHIEEKTKSGGFASVHNLPSTKTQQYYEMIGKYDQFVFGWEDIDNNELNPSLADNVYKENTSNIKSPLRTKYMKIRGDSNDKLNAGQRGIHIMLINRILSAINAGRLAYKHNKKLDSDLSMVRIQFVQKHIIDHDVTMLTVMKKF